MKLQHVIILQNKIDLIKETEAKEQHSQITQFVQGETALLASTIPHYTDSLNPLSVSAGTVAEKASVVPISAQLKYNIDIVCELIATKIPIPRRDFLVPARLIVIRSFDVNKPGATVNGVILSILSLIPSS